MKYKRFLYLISSLLFLFIFISCSITPKQAKKKLEKMGYQCNGNALLDSARIGHSEAVKLLLKAGIDPNIREPEDGWTPLMFAAGWKHTDITNILINNGADINAQDYVGFTVLIWAAMGGDTTIIKTILNKGADVNVKNKVGVTALMMAADHGYADAVKLLLDNKADINAATSIDGTTALMGAVENGKIDVVKVLIAYGADLNLKNKKGETALMLATKKKHIDIVKILQQTGIKK